MKKARLTLRQRKAFFGVLFTLPFIIGFVLFFLDPLIKSLLFSVSELSITPTGYELEYLGLAHYNHILFINTDYLRTIVESVLDTLKDIPIIIFFSFFVAVLLNQKFKGRGVARVIFFLPVIMAAGVVLRLEKADTMTSILQNIALSGPGGSKEMFSDESVRSFFLQMQLPPQLLEYLINAIDNVAETIRASGIQILIFLAGLQSIPASFYEAADVEGATGWERFWIITFPLMTPLLLTNVVYTFVDLFTSPSNKVMESIYDTAFTGKGYNVSSAMAWFYFVVIGILLAIIVKVISKGVFYRD